MILADVQLSDAGVLSRRMVNKVESQLLVIMLKTTAAHQFCRINSAITVSHQTEKTKTVQLATAYASVALVHAFEVQNLQRCLPVFFTVFDCAKQRCVLVFVSLLTLSS